MNYYLRIALFYFGFAGLRTLYEEIKMKDCMFIIIIFIISMIVILATGIYIETL